MDKLLGIDKLIRLFAIIRQNGGIRGTLYKIYRQEEAKLGTLVGVDKYGNKYFQNNFYFFARNRWVEYADYQNMNYDASQVPADWYGWLHNSTDLTPCENPARKRHCWMSDHVENMSGTSSAYMPYSTTCPKIHAWKPPKCSTVCDTKKQEVE